MIFQVVEKMERETGIEPATNSLEGCDSTTELLPLSDHSILNHRLPNRLSAGIAAKGDGLAVKWS